MAKSNNTLGLNFAIVAKHILLAVLIWFCIVPLFSLSIERTIGAHRITCWCGPDYIQIDRLVKTSFFVCLMV